MREYLHRIALTNRYGGDLIVSEQAKDYSEEMSEQSEWRAVTVDQLKTCIC